MISLRLVYLKIGYCGLYKYDLGKGCISTSLKVDVLSVCNTVVSYKVF